MAAVAHAQGSRSLKIAVGDDVAEAPKSLVLDSEFLRLLFLGSKQTEDTLEFWTGSDTKELSR
jgi:hypothetical protein